MQSSIKNKIRNLLMHSNILPTHDFIVFESNPELSGNTMAVFLEMIHRGINKKYKMIWLVQDKTKYSNYPFENVAFYDYIPKTKFEKISLFWKRYTAKALIYENRFLGKHSVKQLSFYLMHGTPIKKLLTYRIDDMCDYVLSQAEKLNDMVSRELCVSLDKICTLGFPRTDDLVKNCSYLKKVFGLTDFNKNIIWMPTYRKGRADEKVYGKFYSLGIPLIDNLEQLEELNSRLRHNNVCLIIKIHPVQEHSFVNKNSYSNLLFLDDDEIINKGCTVYEFIGLTDALVTDYSSIYYDYLYINRPIGLVIDDIEQYINNRGFAVDYEKVVKGEYIRDLNELFSFVDDIANGIDRHIEDRQWAINEYCTYLDFKSTRRVTDFILEKIR